MERWLESCISTSANQRIRTERVKREKSNKGEQTRQDKINERRDEEDIDSTKPKASQSQGPFNIGPTNVTTWFI